MKRFCSMFVSAVMILACQCPVWAELSSKSKKAEKLITEGNIPGATEIYKELMAKDPVKNAALVKEGREGYAKMQLGLEKESLKYKRYDEVEKFVKEIITDYKETPSAKDAYQDMVTMRVGSGEKLFDDAKYDACMSLMNDTKKAVPADTEGLKGVTELSGKALLAAASAANKTKDNEKALAYIAMLNKLELTADSPLTAKSAELSASIGKELLAAAESDIASAKYDGALKNIELALTTSKDADFAAQAKYDTGLANRLNGQADKAAVSYQDVLDNHKASVFAPLAAYDLYLINLDKGSKTEALSDITAAADLKPENVDYQMIRAKLLSDTGGQDEAKKIYTGLIDKLQGQIDKAYTGKEKLQYNLGEVYMKLESYPEAAIELDKAVSRDPSFTAARKSLAMAQFKEKSFAPAQQNYDILIKAASADYDKMKTASSKASEPSAMESQKLEQQRILVAYYHFQNGLCWEQLRDYVKAEQECRLGLEGVPTKEAAATMKRIQQAAADKQALQPAQAAPAPSTAPVQAPATAVQPPAPAANQPAEPAK